MTTQQVAVLLHGRRSGKGRWMARCPVHDDRSASLSICDMGMGKTRLHCFAGCSQADILKSKGLTWRDLGVGGEMPPEIRKRIYEERLLEFQDRLITAAMLCASIWPQDRDHWRKEARTAWKRHRELLRVLDPENESKRLREEDYRRLRKKLGEAMGTEAFIRKYCNWNAVKESK